MICSRREGIWKSTQISQTIITTITINNNNNNRNNNNNNNHQEEHTEEDRSERPAERGRGWCDCYVYDS